MQRGPGVTGGRDNAPRKERSGRGVPTTGAAQRKERLVARTPTQRGLSGQMMTEGGGRAAPRPRQRGQQRERRARIEECCGYVDF
jgi:hypothetical protein